MRPDAAGLRAEEEPEEPDPAPQSPQQATTPLVVGGPGTSGVEFEYRTEQLTAAQVLDGSSLPSLLAKESADGWDLVDLLTAEEKHVVLLRKPKKPVRADRRVGFFNR